MSTERLYYDHSELTEFSARVTCMRVEDRQVWITLDRSAFYPTSGGQPYDTGVLCAGDRSVDVSDVEVRDGEVWHRIGGMLFPGTEVTGTIDRDRRRDHTQQHGGEHMLAGAVWRLLGGTTIGLHLGAEDSSIDVTLPDGRTRLEDGEIRLLEEFVNTHIQADEEIRCWFPSEEELAALPLRKPPTVTEHVRIVAIGDWEMVACGGTHPKRTGEIGLVKILSVAPARGKARITFVCGMRAFRYFSVCQRSAERAGQLLSVRPGGLNAAVEALKEKCASLERELSSCRAEEYERRLEGENGVLYLEEGDISALQEAVSRYIRQPERIALTGAAGRLIFARGADAAPDMAALLRRVARGGGRPDMASGAGGEEAVRAAAALLTEPN